jgi:putative ABC transport system substrate-binding protein
MKTQRRSWLAVIAAAVLLVLPPVTAGQPGRTYRVGIVTGNHAAVFAPNLAAFRHGLSELGYVEGRNLTLDTRFADGHFERLPSLVEELTRLRPDVLLAATTPASMAAKATTTTIPIVFVAVADPLGVGLVSNLARPGGNITGITHIVAELTGKRLELLTQIVPSASRIAVFVNRDDPNAPLQIRRAEAAARSLKIQLHPVVNVRGVADVEPAFNAAVRSRAAAVLRMVDPAASSLRAETAALALRYRLPVMYAFREDVEAGGLVAYGANLVAQYRQAATFVHKLLGGAKPAELPIEQPTRFEFVINMKTARRLGITIPASLLLHADHVVE